jgi:WD40 repeat protein
LIDPATWEPIEPIAAHDGAALDVAVNESGTLIASAGDDAYVRVWNVADRSLVTEIKFDVDEIANVEFIDDAHLFVTAGFGSEAVVITLDPDELLDIARSRLIRSFTAAECAQFGIDPCPTLEEIKSDSG